MICKPVKKKKKQKTHRLHECNHKESYRVLNPSSSTPPQVAVILAPLCIRILQAHCRHLFQFMVEAALLDYYHMTMWVGLQVSSNSLLSPKHLHKV